MTQFPTVLLLSMLLVSPIAAAAPVPASVPEKTITLDTVNADLHSVVAMLEKHAGIKAIVQNGSRPYRLVTLHLQTTSLPKVIRSIAFSAGATATQNADGVYIFAPEEAVGSAEPVSATSAQISTPAKVTPRSVAIKVEFLPVYKADLDSFGVNFIPLPDTLFSYTTGNIASQLFQVLTRTGGRRGHDTLVTTSDNVAGGISVDTEVYDAMCHAAPAKALPGTSGQPEFFHLQGMLAFTPHITPNRFVRIDISPANIDDKPLVLKAIPSEETMAILAPATPGPTHPILGGLVRVGEKLSDTKELLIFITPTILPPSTGSGGISIMP